MLEQSKLNDIDTPMMRQYREIKKEAGDKLLFFRMGDFYELFGDDAKLAAPILGIALTVRDKKNEIPMCGIPYHAVNNYISKLTDKGFSVAICEQLENPKQTKTVVKRGIVRIITPALSYDPESIKQEDSLYLVSILGKEGAWSYSALEYSTGRFFANTVARVEELINNLEVLGVKELVFSRDQHIPKVLQNFIQNISFTVLDVDTKDLKKENIFGIMVDSVITEQELWAAKTILYYVRMTQFKDEFPHINYLSRGTRECRLAIDEFSIKNLELLTELYPIINYTRTAMGARLLKRTLLEPLHSIKAIRIRQKNLEYLLNTELTKLKKSLSLIPDIERLTTKVLSTVYTPQTVFTLLSGVLNAIALINEYKVVFNTMDTDFSELEDFTRGHLLNFADTVPNNNTYGIFKRGAFAKLDRLIELTEQVNTILKTIEEREKTETGISNLKIRFNKVFGYYIEVSKGNASKVPNSYIRKQTLVNAERFITPELKELEQQIIEAEQERLDLELSILKALVDDLRQYVKKLGYLSVLISELDLLFSFAVLSFERDYIKPEIHEGFDLELKGLRHPILENYLKEKFIPNDLVFKDSNFFHVVTGPNMSGKSTLMRAVSLVIILAHMGAFVPATYAKIPITDKIFTRVGATDYIARGQSTFMVEMVEAANILKSASKRSFIIIDEIGRGTSTFDGISIAWSVAEYINKQIGAKCMFATHYHELTALEGSLFGVKNYSMSVEENNKNLIFTRRYINSPSQKSYGINVAKMAGLPKEVIKRAAGILKQFESTGHFIVDSRSQPSLFDQEYEKDLDKTQDFYVKSAIFEELVELDPNNMTPLEALDLIYKWKRNSLEDA